MGLEPTTLGTTNRCSNQLSYNHHVIEDSRWVCKIRIIIGKIAIPRKQFIKPHILILASWYPNPKTPLNGNFIQRHALVLSQKCRVSIIHTYKDNSLERSRWVQTLNLNENCTEFVVGYRSRSRFFKYLHAAKAVYSALKLVKKRAKVSHVFLNVFYPLGVHFPWLKWFLPNNWYALEHWTGYHFDPSQNARHLNTARYVSRHCKSVIAVSQDLSNAMKNAGLSNVKGVVFNAVNTSLFNFKQSEANDKLTLLHVSSLKQEHKNFELLLKSFATCNQLNKLELSVINSGDEAPYLPLIQELNLKDKVHFLGSMSIDSVAKEMQRSNVFVLSSNYENMPCVIEEALCAGLPVLSTNVGGISEIVNDSNGILVPPQNHLAFAQALDEITEYYARFDLNQIAQEAKNKFGEQALLSGFEEILEL